MDCLEGGGEKLFGGTQTLETITTKERSYAVNYFTQKAFKQMGMKMKY